MLWLLAAHALAQTVVDVDIAAPPEVVWQVLTDFDHYSDWNPWLIEAKGDALEGGIVDAVVILGDKQRVASHRVWAVDEARELCWRDRGWFTVFARGWRCRTLVATEAGTHFRVELVIEGLFKGMVNKRFGEVMRLGMEAETAALAAQAEVTARE